MNIGMRVVVVGVFLILSACKLQITVPENGQVITESGTYICPAGSTCTIDILDTLFDEAFIAEPASGYEFVQWARVPLAFCGGSSDSCYLTTTFFGGNVGLMNLLASDLQFALSPVFARQAPPATDPGDPLVELGEALFFNETFGGNGRTCGTCHRAENNFTIDPAFIATLPLDDPLFVAETNPELAGLEDPAMLRQFGLIRANADGFEAPAEKFVLRSVSHLFGLASTLESNTTEAPFEMTGWSGDGAPGDGTLRDFSSGAVIQHFTRTLDRVEGVDFRLPTAAELDALEAFMLSLGVPATIDLQALRLSDTAAETGRQLFITEDSENGTKRAAKCNACHRNAGALTIAGINQNFDTGVENAVHPADILGIVRPVDGGFGTQLNAISGGFGDGTFNPVALVHAADTAPFFHNNMAGTLEEAIAHYESNAFRMSPEGQRLQLADSGGSELTVDVDALAAFLRVINMIENIRSSVEHLNRAKNFVTDAGIQKVLGQAMVDIDDVQRVLAESMIHEEVVPVMQDAKANIASAMTEPLGNTVERDGFVDLAIAAALAGRDQMVTVLPPLDSQAPVVEITAPAAGTAVFHQVQVSATASDDIEVSNVIFRVGATDIGHDSTAPYEIALNTANFPDGEHVLMVTAVDSSNNSASVTQALIIDNASVAPPPDTTNPTVAITSPQDGDNVADAVLITADASDDTGIDSVVFSVDGAQLGQFTTPPYQQSWDTSAFSEGAHNLVVTAFDAAGNSASTGITVTVDNSSSTEPACTVYSCPNPPSPPTEPPPEPITPDGSSPDGEFDGEVTNVDLVAQTVTIDSAGVVVTLQITTATEFAGSLAASIEQILIGHIAQGEFFQSAGEALWIEIDLPPGL
jgi:cytochrome c peroxidase